MFELGLPEILVIGGAALLLFGPKRLPELAKSLGKGIRDFKKALEEDDTKQNPTKTGEAAKEALPPSAAVTSVAPGVENLNEPAGKVSGDPDGTKNS